jgi:hypothetical protein
MLVFSENYVGVVTCGGSCAKAIYGSILSTRQPLAKSWLSLRRISRLSTSHCLNIGKPHTLDRTLLLYSVPLYIIPSHAQPFNSR